MTDTRVAMFGRPQYPIKIGSLRLSADGKLATFNIFFDEFLPQLVVFDIDREELMVCWTDPLTKDSWTRCFLLWGVGLRSSYTACFRSVKIRAAIG